jgi:Family of unknown function (DUF6207)
VRTRPARHRRAGFDDDTVLAFQAASARTCGTATAESTTRDAGQSGVRLRLDTDLRQALEEATRLERAPASE